MTVPARVRLDVCAQNVETPVALSKLLLKSQCGLCSYFQCAAQFVLRVSRRLGPSVCVEIMWICGGSASCVYVKRVPPLSHPHSRPPLLRPPIMEADKKKLDDEEEELVAELSLLGV